jgi:SSS family solute:Na+ symporter
VDIGDLAFGGFAQLALPVIVALYWRRTNRTGMVAGILLPQVVYVAFSFLPATPVALPGLGEVTLFAGAYLGWGVSLYCMLLGLLTTLVVSWVSSPGVGETVAMYFEDLSLD